MARVCPHDSPEGRKITAVVLECLPPSKYFAGSCYTYIPALTVTSWDRAFNNCLHLPLAKDARLLVVDSVAEYEFVERELIGPKSGSDSVSVYVGLRKINGEWSDSRDVRTRDLLFQMYGYGRMIKC